jgi:hypothetical protein
MARSRAAAQETRNTPAPLNNPENQLPMVYDAAPAAGFEDATRDAFAIPFLYVLQSLSPQCKKSDGAYIKGAEEGMLYNTVTQELFGGDEGVEIIPCSFTHTFVEWGLRESGGGFISEFDSVSGHALKQRCKRDDRGRDILPSGNHLADTRNHYVLIKDGEGNWQPVLMSLTSTQIKASRNWMSAMQRTCESKRCPMFALKYRLTTVPQQNEKGSWYGIALELIGLVDSVAEYNQAKAFYEQVRLGAVKTDRTADGAAAGASSDGGAVDPDDM